MYSLPHKNYNAKRLEDILWTRTMHGVPLKRVEFFSGEAAPGLYGFTYLGSGTINLNDHLCDGCGVYEKHGVEVHETLHQDDEYDTRRWTEAKLETLDPRNSKYLAPENSEFNHLYSIFKANTFKNENEPPYQ